MALTRNVTAKVIIDLLLCIIIGIPILVLRYGVYPYKRGFYCDDESLAYPNKPDTISMGMLVPFGFIIPLASMLIGEIVWYRLDRGSSTPTVEYQMCKKTLPNLVVILYKTMGVFIFGAAVCQTSTDIVKYTLGRLRPHWLAVCQPDWSNFNCTLHGQMRYITEDVCTGDAKHIREARLSHVSGHSSFICYTMIYLIFYIQSRLSWRGSKLLKHLLQALAMYSAVYTCLSRVSDYKHHWSDVLGGTVLGTCVAFIMVFWISDLFKVPRMKEIAKKISEIHSQYKKSDTFTSVNSERPLPV